jgi:hypothetical protein
MGRKRQGNVERHLPLKPAVFHMLVALSEAESYGYGVIRSVRQRSGGRIDLQTGTFYRHLRRLLDDGLVAERGAGPAGDDPRPDVGGPRGGASGVAADVGACRVDA